MDGNLPYRFLRGQPLNIQRLLRTVIKFHVVKEAKEAVLYFVQDF